MESSYDTFSKGKSRITVVDTLQDIQGRNNEYFCMFIQYEDPEQTNQAVGPWQYLY